MMKNYYRVAAAGWMLAAGPVVAADWAVTGLIREEAAVKLSKDQNTLNWAGIPYNGVAVANTGLGAAGTPTLTRPAAHAGETDLNLLGTRIELSVDGSLTPNWSAHFKLRGYTDQVGRVEKIFEDKNIFKQTYGSADSGGRLGAAGKDWMVDLPNAYLDYSDGPLWVRMGNQQIAWGEALFFRVADVANGLDYRRHLILDPASEEFADKRVSALAVRGNFRFSETSSLEGFVQQFSPSVLPPENSPYNLIAAQFIIDQKTSYDENKNKLNFGARFQGKLGDVGVQAFAVRRYNPDGVYKWTLATDKGAIAGTPFSAATGVGVYNAKEWFNTATAVRLDGVQGLENALNQFPGTSAGGALAGAVAAVAAGCGAANATPGSVHVNGSAASCMLDTFFDPKIGFGNLRGSLSRNYVPENVFGFGLNTVFEGAPDSLTDQLIGRFELSYTPNKKFTNPSLSRNYVEKNETSFALIFEKYHKFSQELPATYMVLQWMHKSASDIFGRSLLGNNNIAGLSPTGQDGGSNNIALVMQQPTLSLEWRFDFAALTDLKGGLLLQPGMKWKIDKAIQVDVYANYLRSSNRGRDFAESLKYGRELFLRASYYF